MEWKKISKAEAIVKYDEYFSNEADKKVHEEELDEDYRVLREVLKYENNKIKYKYKDNPLYKYYMDIYFGAILYEELSIRGFTIADASNDENWYYLSLCVLPDLVEDRWGNNDNRFYNSKRRIWLKCIWMYHHLSYQEEGTKKTLEILSKNNTDMLVQLTERTGGKGYRVDLYRKLMRRYFEYISNIGDLSEKEQKSARDLFRRMMVINTYKSQAFEPDLFEGGVDGYVEEIFNDATRNVA